MFKCWYEDVQNYFAIRPGIGLTDARVCYAQSADGVHWEKPRLGIRAIDGMDTNVCSTCRRGRAPGRRPSSWTRRRGPVAALSRCCTSSTSGTTARRPGCGPTRTRFRRRTCTASACCMQVSSDGVRWQPHPANPIIPYWAGDVEILTYDPIDRKYVLYGRARKWTSPRAGFAAGDMPVWPDKPDGVWNTRRCVHRLESDDCLRLVRAGHGLRGRRRRQPRRRALRVRPLARDEMHLGLLNVFHQVDNVMESTSSTARTGRQCHRPRCRGTGRSSRAADRAYRPLGAERRASTRRQIESDDEVRIYYGGMNVHHDWWISGHAARPGPSRGPRPGAVARRPSPLSGDAAAGTALGVSSAGSTTGHRETKHGRISMRPCVRSSACCGPAVRGASSVTADPAGSQL
ncbi:hypothetical protein GBAR_LOCUS9140 [Geodia barretti]|uniref:Uncharacterized protein n=1 Tax=Geodia barretti TaxID=519541 RepID=A0AA35RP49_GEOBA|nr:hypothetical protein GBAR_LOCUS9140 [Geodia barretti]